MKNSKYINLYTGITILVFITQTSFISLKNPKNLVSIFLKNKYSTDIKSFTVEVPWSKLKGLKADEVVVKSLDSGLEIPSQVIYCGENSPQALIFQTDIKSNIRQKFIIQKGTPSKYKIKTYGRQIPERFDDFTWENDKVAFRMYGEALESQKGMAKGIDFWAKKTSEMVINRWYKFDNYHKDNGEGVDAYHVGITLGAGNAEPFDGEKIIFPINYSSYKILDQGPIRISFKLFYKPFIVNGKVVSETKLISLDAGHHMNKIINQYITDSNLSIALGVTKHVNDGISKIDTLNNIIAYWDKADGGIGNGYMGVGVVYPKKYIQQFKNNKQHLLMVINLNKENELIYYQGGGWSKSGEYNTEQDWFDYLINFKTILNSPLEVKIK